MTGLQSLLPSFALTDWMVDTFIYTGLLIALVLLARHKVAQHFGPQVAYALWALPLLRLIMPPIVLPAWMAPAEPAADMAAASGAEPLLVFISDAPAATSGVVAAAAPAVGITVTELLFPLWLAGAAIFLGWRVREYIRMRRDLLADARPVGESGKVRLVETSAVSAPVAFGVRDKVVALPMGFLALLDMRARDMAIAHELEHHRGHDLLANIAAQPLLALHWFNPLAWWGWRAMRRDQEAACDARVVAGRARSERAAYAEVIAGFAAGEHLALAAPMACPVLGEKSIIHRLRSLTLTDISTRRRRIGIAAITTTALALPLTASISYAQPPVQQQDETPAIETIDPSGDQRVVRIERRVIGDGDGGGEFDIDMEGMEDGEHVIVRTVDGEDGERRVIRRVVRHGGDGESHEMNEAEIEAMMAELEREMEGLGERVGNQIEIALAHRTRAGRAGANTVVINEGEEGSHNIDVRCDGEEAVAHQQLSDGRQAMVVCHTAIRAHAAEGLRHAITAISNNSSIPAETRAEIRRELERAISEMNAARAEIGRVSMRAAPPAPPRPPKAPRAAAPTNRISYGYSTNGAVTQSTRFAPLVHPLTGRPESAPHSEEDCENTEAGINA